MAAAISRAGFLRGRFASGSDAIRPPWSVNEAEFTSLCTRQLSCADVCPENIIIKGGAGFPEISFTDNECTFCGACAKACPVGALGPSHDQAGLERSPWNLKLGVSDACLSAKGVVCRICPEKCDAQAIRFNHPAAHGKPVINQDRCNGCGACIAPCPSQALALFPAQQYKAA
jgi:ferredoxin-type protein NapF